MGLNRGTHDVKGPSAEEGKLGFLSSPQHGPRILRSCHTYDMPLSCSTITQVGARSLWAHG